MSFLKHPRRTSNKGGGVLKDVPLDQQEIGAWKDVLDDYEREQETINDADNQ